MSSITERPSPAERDTPLAEALAERYLAYALSTIMSRSLPDVRDGLKPVHRRLIYAMHVLRLDPGAGFKKCARVVGDVIGKYHPHGDAAVYEALVRLAQDFAVRYPLIEGQGNFGNIDGDNAAAMRYTEARLTPLALALLEGIEEEAVDFRPNYDGEEKEPVVLPAAFPHLLASGASGIAVGMATSIPPHNLAELCQAAIHLIDHPEASTADLMRHVQGPDFPTGGVIIDDPASLIAAYESGRGQIRLRARWAVESGRHGTWRIVVSEIPYLVPKSKIIEDIAALLEARKLPLLEDVRDESDTKVRIVLEPRSRNVDPALLMEALFKASPLESRFSLNLTVIDRERTPRLMGLKGLLAAWLAHREEVLIRRTRHRLAAIARRLELLAGYLLVYLNLDEVIAIIRQEDEPKPRLMARFGLSDTQAEAILNMRLRALRRLEEEALRLEQAKLEAERDALAPLLVDPARRAARLKEEIAAIAARFGDPRRTTLAPLAALPRPEAEAFIEREPLTVVLSEKGWIRALRGRIEDGRELRFKEGDRLRVLLPCESTDRLLVLATNGRAFTVRAADLPRGRGDGQPLRLLVDIGNEADAVALLVAVEEGRYLLASSGGRGFIVRGRDLIAEKRTGRQVFTLRPGEELAAALPVSGDCVAVIGTNRRLLVFPLAEVPEMSKGGGVVLQKYREGELSDITLFNRAEGLAWRSGERETRLADVTPWLAHRAGQGKPAPSGFPRSNRFTPR